jgi:hypothetical protein
VNWWRLMYSYFHVCAATMISRDKQMMKEWGRVKWKP